jgi:hypothetical protein
MTALADFRDTAQAVVAPGVLTTAAVSLAGYLEDANAAAPLNAVSHIPFGEEAFEQEPTVKSTATSWRSERLNEAFDVRRLRA